MNTFNLTDKEMKAARILVQSCFDAMGGSRPGDLAKDEYTWINIKDLTENGYTRHEAAGLLSSLQDKGFVSMEGRDSHVTTDGWKWMDTIW